MPILIEKNKYFLKKVAKVMLEFKDDGVHAGNSDTLLTYRKQAISIAQSEIKNPKKLKNKPSCGKKKKIN